MRDTGRADEHALMIEKATKVRTTSAHENIGSQRFRCRQIAVRAGMHRVVSAIEDSKTPTAVVKRGEIEAGGSLTPVQRHSIRYIWCGLVIRFPDEIKATWIDTSCAFERSVTGRGIPTICSKRRNPVRSRFQNLQGQLAHRHQ
jgi:hypothetical protein